MTWPLYLLLVLILFTVPPGYAQEEDYSFPEDIYDLENYDVQDLQANEEIALNGQIVSVDRRSFVLDYVLLPKN